MSTCDHLDSQTLGSQPIMPENLLVTASSTGGTKGHFHTRANSRDHETMRAQKKVSVQKPSQDHLQNHVVWSWILQVWCEVICD